MKSIHGPLLVEGDRRQFGIATIAPLLFRWGGRFGTTLDYAQQTYERLLELGIHDQDLADLLRCAP